MPSNEGETALRREDHIARGVLAHRCEGFAVGFFFNVVAQQLPRAMNCGGGDGLGGLNRTDAHN